MVEKKKPEFGAQNVIRSNWMPNENWLLWIVWHMPFVNKLLSYYVFAHFNKSTEKVTFRLSEIDLFHSVTCAYRIESICMIEMSKMYIGRFNIWKDINLMKKNCHDKHFIAK